MLCRLRLFSVRLLPFGALLGTCKNQNPISVNWKEMKTIHMHRVERALLQNYGWLPFAIAPLPIAFDALPPPPSFCPPPPVWCAPGDMQKSKSDLCQLKRNEHDTYAQNRESGTAEICMVTFCCCSSSTCRPASTCPAQPPSKAGGASPRAGERHHGVGKADWSTETDRTGRGAAHHAGPRGTPERHAAGHNQSTGTGAKQQRPPGAANPGSAHNTQRTTAPERVRGNTKPTHHKRHPRMAGYKRSAQTQAHTPRHTSQEWRGAAKLRAQTHTPTPHTRARGGRVQEERARKRRHTRTHQPGVAGSSQNPSQSAHTHAAHPSQEWRVTGGARKQTHTHPNTPARSGGGSRNPSQRSHTHTAHPSQEWRGTFRARTQTRTTHHRSRERRGAAETGAQTHTRTPHSPARSGAVQAECASKHTHTPTPKPGLAGRS